LTALVYLHLNLGYGLASRFPTGKTRLDFVEESKNPDFGQDFFATLVISP
jgi:hypothetical protein